jgi:sulfite dehydrogenase (cytochrome) subunit B
MTPRIKSVVLSLGLAALVAGCGHSSNISKEPEHGIASREMASMLDSKPGDPVHTIVMPHDEPVFPPGPGRDEFVTACVVCHSPRYITMQPQFSRATWLSEVNKMKDVYGAHISDEQVQKITAYLVSINGKPDAGQAPKGTYGE